MKLADFERSVPVAETHISRIVAIGDRVYKRKVPKAFGFVDQRSLEARRRLCELEVTLNRRVAPDVYLGVEPVVDSAGSVLDYAVVMRRLPSDRSLAAMVAAGVEAESCLRAVARVVAGFHARADRSDDITAAGTRQAVANLWLASLDDLATFSAEHIETERLDVIRRRADTYLGGRGLLFEARVQRGLIVDGHGDLLTPDIYCLDDGVRILDCLEFDERFRFGDVLLDVAFLVMDLHWRGRPDLAEAFMNTYQELSDEHHPASLLAHFVAYRALVRAKVALYRAQAGDHGAVAEADTLMRLTEEQLDRATVRLIMVGGLPGTGKTTLAETLSSRGGWVTINTDAVRHELTGRPATAEWMAGAYAPEITDRTYAIVQSRATTALAMGESVVLDASFQDPSRREACRDIGRRAGAAVTELRCAAPQDMTVARLLRRDRSNPSDATPAVAERMAESFAPWPEATTIDTTQPLDESVSLALAAAMGADLRTWRGPAMS